MAKDDIYRLKVTLRNSKPPIWRRIEVPGNIGLDKLHHILQVTMGWWDAHLHQYIVGQTYYGEPHPAYGDDLDMKDERKVKLNRIAPAEKSGFIYEYDFGDSWEHLVEVEKIFPAEAGVRYPRCIKGKRACPPEDVGGIWGYESFIEAIKDPNHPEHEDMLDWQGDDFDPEAFDLEEINNALQQLR